MHHDSLATRVITGATAGLAATALLHKLRGVSQSVVPEATPPMREEPGEFMVEQAESVLPERAREKIPEQVETAAATSLSFGYGATFGALYAALRGRDSNALLDGVALGVGTWAVGYLGWLPALDLMPPVQQQSLAQAVGPIVLHVIYGVATVAAYDTLRQQIRGAA